MRKIFLFVVCMASLGYAQGMPVEVKRFLEDYLNDSTASLGFLHTKWAAERFNEPVRLKDLSVGRVLEAYKIKHIFLNAYPNTTPLSEIIEPSGYWLVLIMAHNKPFYQIFLDNITGKPMKIGGTSLAPDGDLIWGPLLEAYPEPTEISPIFFSLSGHPPNGMRGYEDRFLYFKQLGPRKIYYIRSRQNRPQNAIFTGSVQKLDDSRLLMEYWKKQGLNEVGKVSAEELKHRHANYGDNQ